MCYKLRLDTGQATKEKVNRDVGFFHLMMFVKQMAEKGEVKFKPAWNLNNPSSLFIAQQWIIINYCNNNDTVDFFMLGFPYIIGSPSKAR